MIRRKSQPSSILPLWIKKRKPTTLSTSNPHDNVSVKPRNIDSDCNIQSYKPKMKPLLYLLQSHKLEPLHSVIKHQDTLDKGEPMKIVRQSMIRESFETHQQGNVETHQQGNDEARQQGNDETHQEGNDFQHLNHLEENFQGCSSQEMRDENNVEVKFDKIVQMVENSENPIDEMVKIIPLKSNHHENLNEKKFDEGKGKQVEICREEKEENVSLDDDDFYDDLTINDIIEIFKILNGVYHNGIHYNYI